MTIEAPQQQMVRQGGDTPHTKALAFLSGALALEGHHSAVKIDLSYSPAGGYRTDPLRSWSRERDPQYFEPGEDGATNQVYTEQLVTDIVEIAEGHADSFGTGRHRFVIRVHQHLGGRQTHAFVLLPTYQGEDQSVGGMGSVDLVPTSAGVVGQLMRHLENRDRASQQTLQSFLTAINHHAIQMREENAELRAQLAAKDKERLEWLTTIEAARSTEHDRQIQAQIVVSKEERKTLATKKIINLLPVVLSQWMGSGKGKSAKPGKDGKTADPKPPSPLAKLVGQLIESLSDDQRTQLGDLLSIEQQISFVEVVNVVENGDSILLPTMLNDLVSTLQPRQVASLMALLTAPQREMFVGAVKIASTKADPEGKDDKTADTKVTTETSTPTE
jgi:hypothetical protein